jgi:DNA-binding beta-propeller fold protein YncE
MVANFEHIPGQDTSQEYFNPAVATANPYAMVPDPANRRFLVTDGASGRVLAAGLDGRIRVYSPVEGHEVLTGITWGPDGRLYVASFSQLPHRAGAGTILSIRPDGTAAVVVGNLTTPIDLAFDRAGHLYVLEFADGDSLDEPYRNTVGRLLRFVRQGDGWGAGQVLVEALPYPTAMLLGPDGSLYLSIHGAFSPPGSGEVLRFDNLAYWTQAQSPLQYGIEENMNGNY